MKKIIFTFLFASVCFVFNLSAQTEKGTILLSGALNYQSGSGSFEFGGQEIPNFGGSELSAFALTPRVGYFVSDNLVIGLRPALALAKEEQQTILGTVDINATGLAIAPFGRYYFSLSDRLYLYGELFFNIGSIKLTNDGEEIANYGLTQVGLNPGIAYMFSDKVGLELQMNGISYSNFKEKDADEGIDNFSFGPNLDFRGPMLGVFLYL